MAALETDFEIRRDEAQPEYIVWAKCRKCGVVVWSHEQAIMLPFLIGVLILCAEKKAPYICMDYHECARIGVDT